MTAIDDRPTGKVRGFFSTLGKGTLSVLEGMAEAQAARDTGPAPIEVEASTTAELIRRARLERGMTLEQLSQLTSISRYRLENYESDRWSGLYDPTTDELVRIKTVLNISTASVSKFV